MAATRGGSSRTKLYNTQEALELIFMPGSDDSESNESSDDEPQVFSGADGVSSDEDLNLPGTSDGRTRRENQPNPAKRSRVVSDDDDWDRQNFCPPTVNNLIGNSGIQEADLGDHSTPYDCFNKFVTDELIEKIVVETNRYAQALFDNEEFSLHSRMKAWKPTNANEIRELLAMILLMGVVRKPTLSMYFSTDSLLVSPIFGKCMSRNRFSLLLSVLHFADNSQVAGDDRLYKIRLVVDYFRDKFRTVYLPSEHVCVDESLMLWKGRLGFKQYMPKKRSRFGVKSYELCESDTGYVWDFLVYTGATTEYTEEEGGQGEKVVLTLMGRLLGKNYKLYLDRFFTSPTLAKRLLDSQTYVCGTVMGNRKGMPKRNPGTRLAPGEMKVCQKDGIAVYNWKDKRDVLMLSTMNDNGFGDTGKVNRTTQERILKPNCVMDYNLHMGGVDLCDSVLHAYPCMRKCVKWYKKVFFHMLDIVMYNSCVVYKKLGKCLPLLPFRIQVIRTLFETNHVARARATGGRPSFENPLRLTERHFPSFIPATDKKQNPTRMCRVCSHNGRQRESRYECADCEVALCVDPCFRKFHSMLNF